MDRRRFWVGISIGISIIGIPGTLEDISIWIDWIDNADRWSAEMSFYQQAAPFLFFGGIAIPSVWLVVYKLPEWIGRKRNAFKKLCPMIDQCLDVMHEMEEEGSSDALLSLQLGIPHGWDRLRSRLIALSNELDRLEVPRLSVPNPDYQIDEFYCWREYLSHLAPIAKHGDLAKARGIILDSRR